MALQKQIQTVNRKFDNSHKQNWLRTQKLKEKQVMAHLKRQIWAEKSTVNRRFDFSNKINVA